MVAERPRPQAVILGLTFGDRGHIMRAERAKGAVVKKFLLLLGILGLVIGVVLYIRGRQGDLELEY